MANYEATRYDFDGANLTGIEGVTYWNSCSLGHKLQFHLDFYYVMDKLYQDQLTLLCLQLLELLMELEMALLLFLFPT
jgi:hypothetical protein